MLYQAISLVLAALAMSRFSLFSNIAGAEIWLFVGLVVVYGTYLEIQRRRNPFLLLDGPESKDWFGGHMGLVLDPGRSPESHERFVHQYGRNIRIKGIHPFDERLLPMDPVSVSHVAKNSMIYEKPWQTRRLITSLIGCGLLSSEGVQHKRQRRVITPGFSVQNLRVFVPMIMLKGQQMSDRWIEMLSEKDSESLHMPFVDGAEKSVAGQGDVGKGRLVVDVCRWVSRATFDVIGLACFDYSFNSIQDESNELFCAYRDMFNLALSQAQAVKSILAIWFPWIYWFFPDETSRAIQSGQATIRRVAMQLIQEKQEKIREGEQSGNAYGGKDMLSLLLKSNASTAIAPEQRISDEDVLNSINTFMAAGTDTTSLGLTWTIVLLAKNPHIQSQLRDELLALRPLAPHSSLTQDEVASLWDNVNNAPFLQNVIRESLRLIPPVHSSIRVAVKDDKLPMKDPVRLRDGTVVNEILVPKGTVVHIPIEGMNLDREYWGEDAREFKPDRWNDLPEAVKELPGIYNNLLSFSAGPRACIGLHVANIEMKMLIYILVTDFVFSEDPSQRITKANVVFTRPFVAGRFKEGSQAPLVITHYRRETTGS